MWVTGLHSPRTTATPTHSQPHPTTPTHPRRNNKYASSSPECFVLALVFIDRLIARNTLLLTSFNVHRIIISAVMLAAKFFDDQYFNNSYYAKVGGVPTNEVNSLELEFLFSVNFSLQVTTEVFESALLGGGGRAGGGWDNRPAPLGSRAEGSTTAPLPSAHPSTPPPPPPQSTFPSSPTTWGLASRTTRSRPRPRASARAPRRAWCSKRRRFVGRG